MIKFESEYQIGEKIYVPALESFAHILTVWFTRTGVSYEISYFHDGERKTCYCFGEEIRKQR